MIAIEPLSMCPRAEKSPKIPRGQRMETGRSAIDYGSLSENPRLKGKQTPTSFLFLQVLDFSVCSLDFSDNVSRIPLGRGLITERSERLLKGNGLISSYRLHLFSPPL